MADPSEKLKANRAYIEQQLAAGRRPVRFRYAGGRQKGAQGTMTPLRFLKDSDTLMGIDHSVRGPRSFKLKDLDTLSDDEPRPEPERLGDPAEVERNEAFRAKRKRGVDAGVDEQLGTNLMRFVPDRQRDY